jgi:hypothetical protein
MLPESSVPPGLWPANAACRHRARPLALVATPDADLAQDLIVQIQSAGFPTCVARSAAGCLRVATAVGPDLVLLDDRLPRRLEGMLRSHPATATAELVRVGARSGSGPAWEGVSGARPAAQASPRQLAA